MKSYSKSTETGVSIQQLCQTRCTARTSAMEAVLKNYNVLMDTMAEASRTGHDEYDLKARGILTTLEKSDTLLVLKLSHLFFGTAEEMSKCL